ncbi:hypothetical protein OEM_33050 [Mycobacterium intracellulare subsp. yongonense 05-1390]|nr:hypothetical protein OEM_33050 [Mycobacterium intracellulare subsp. yongonense 05-1390]
MTAQQTQAHGGGAPGNESTPTIGCVTEVDTPTAAAALRL